MTEEAPPSRRASVHLALVLALFAIGSMEWKGYRFGGSNQSLQVPLLKHLADPSLYTRDPVLTSFEGYSSFFFQALAPAVRVTGVEPLYFALYLLLHMAALAALFGLARRLFASTAAGVIACVLYVAAVPSLGAEFTYWPRLTHAHAATAVLLGALYFYVAGRTRLAFVLCGLAFDIHALYAAYVGAMLLGDSVLRLRERGARRVAGDAAALLLLAAPTLLWILRRHDVVATGEWATWLAIMRERSASHTFPSLVPADVFGRYVVLIAIGGLAWSVLPDAERPRTIVHFAIAIGVLCAIGVLGAEVVPIRRIIEAQLLRSTKWLTVFVLLYVARLAVVSWDWGGLARVAAAAVVGGLVLQQPGWLALGLALYLVGQAPRWPLPAAAAGGLALVIAAATGAADLPERLGVQQAAQALSAVLQRPAVAACLAGFVLLRAAAGRTGALARHLPVAAALAAIVYALPRMYVEHRAAVAAEPWNDVQLWARAHTPRDAVLLTPPYREGFRVFSERAIVGEWKDGTQQFFSWPFTALWRRRMVDVRGGEEPLYDTFSAEELAAVARQYGAEYAVVAAATTAPFDRLYENPEFAVYRIPRVGTASAAP